MPNRILREGVLTSEPVNSLSWPAEVFYRRLMSAVDDFGRYYAKPELLRAACYPLKLDKVGNQDVAKWLGETQKAGLVRAYTVDGKEYLELLNFRQQVRAKVSKFPQPIGDCTSNAQQMRSASTASAHLDGDGDGDGDDSAPQSGPPRQKHHFKTRLPADFGISDRVRAWAIDRGYLNLDAHLEHFVGVAKAKGYAYVDWDHAFMNAVRKDWAGIGKGSDNRPRLAQ